MHLITPQSVSRNISFKAKDFVWGYQPDSPMDIAKIQCEGTAKLWNLLLSKSVALLADEVGMGKTYQALGVMMTLWQQKPTAKVLLYAPNDTVAKKWIREYNGFIKNHYKHKDGKIKSPIDESPMRQAIYCENHTELMIHAHSNWPSFLVCRTSTLSHLLPASMNQRTLNSLNIDFNRLSKEDEDKAGLDYYSQFARLCNSKLYDWLSKDGEPPFDLLIFDEAHYLRRVDSYTKRNISAFGFFNGQNKILVNDSNFKPIASKSLLLTATPNHSGQRDIVNIISLFAPEYTNYEPSALLDQLCVRRFRRLAGMTKHEYRREIDQGVELKTLKEKLFFMNYQRSLVKHQAEKLKNSNSSKNSINPYRILFGFLEGFEFLPQNNETPENRDEVDDRIDFSKQEDREIIISLSSIFTNIYRERPSHPKYEYAVNRFIPINGSRFNFHSDKSIVFVRRIPSTSELSKRIIDEFDRQFEKIWIKSKIFKPDMLRKYNDDALRQYLSSKQFLSEDAIELKENPARPDEQITDNDGPFTSRILNLFTVKKDGKGAPTNTTDCSNFRLRFTKKDQFFSLFFEPGADYGSEAYKPRNFVLVNDKRQFQDTATLERLTYLKNIENTEFIQTILRSELKNIALKSISGRSYRFETLFTIFLKLKTEDESILQAQKEYNQFNLLEKEVFSSYIKKGILYASAYIVLFYAWYHEIRDIKREALYQSFMRKVKAEFINSGLAEFMSRVILSFRLFYSKELGKKVEQLFGDRWSLFEYAPPAFGVSAQTKRESILQAFNTPFFPNVLISTSVLQEGVDLHYQCNQVMHYGIAWTQGDNEQRVGRVDRLNGKMENLLSINPEAELSVQYPYLTNTLDEDQISRFITRKHLSEKLIDRFEPHYENNEVGLGERVERSVWKALFKKPDKSGAKNLDPYPVKPEKDFKDIQDIDTPPEGILLDFEMLLNPILKSIEEEFGNAFLNYSEDRNNRGSWIFGIKHVFDDGSERHQPLVAQVEYYEEGFQILNKPIYVMRIKTPLSHPGVDYNDLRIFGNLKDEYINHPMIKICFDQNDQNLFKHYCCIDLSIFIINDNSLNLSHEEVIKSIKELIVFSDNLERKFSGGDIKNEQVFKDNFESSPYAGEKLGKDRKFKLRPGWDKYGLYGFKYKEINWQADGDLFTNNHNHYLRKFCRDSEYAYKMVGLYANDSLEEEMILLERILN